MLKNNNNQELDNKKLNDVIGLTKKILKIAYILIAVLGVYAMTLLIKEWHIAPFIYDILKVAAPLFIGVIIAWLFDPFVTNMKKKGLTRVLGSIVTYVLIIGLLFVVISSIIPLLSNQISDFAKTIPTVFDSIKDWVNNIFKSLAHIKNFDVEATKLDIFHKLNDFGLGLTNDLPDMTVNFLQSFFAGLGNLLIGLIIGFYLLVSFDSVNESLLTFLPNRFRKDSKKLIMDIDNTLRNFVKGAVIDSTFVFIVTSALLWMVGLKAPVLFGLFCGITNVIPYAGPYIGGIPAIIFGFSQNPTVGVLTLLVIILVQFFEGNFFQPIIMSKSTKLHPVTIMLGLLIFGHFWGIIGMFVSTPVIAVLKSIFVFFDNKYDILNFYK